MPLIIMAMGNGSLFPGSSSGTVGWKNRTGPVSKSKDKNLEHHFHPPLPHNPPPSPTKRLEEAITPSNRFKTYTARTFPLYLENYVGGELRWSDTALLIDQRERQSLALSLSGYRNSKRNPQNRLILLGTRVSDRCLYLANGTC